MTAHHQSETVLRWQREITNEEATHQLGVLLGQKVSLPCAIALDGELGAGKTTLTKAIAEGFGVRALRDVSSPTYALAHEYPAARGILMHLDFYRLKTSEEVEALGLLEYFAQKDTLVVVEWAGRFPHILPAETLWLTLSPGINDQARHVTLLTPNAELAAALGFTASG